MGIIRVPVRITYQGAGGPGFNVWHVRTISDVDEKLLVADALDALDDFYRGIEGLWPSGTSITIGEGMIKDPLGSPTYFPDDSRVYNPPPQSTMTSAMLAIVVSWRTTSASRSGRGRTFVGPIIGAAAEADGTPTAAALTKVRNAASGLVSASSGPGGWSFGVLSTKQGVLRDFTGSSVKDRWSFLSSRRD